MLVTLEMKNFFTSILSKSSLFKDHFIKQNFEEKKFLVCDGLFLRLLKKMLPNLKLNLSCYRVS